MGCQGRRDGQWEVLNEAAVGRRPLSYESPELQALDGSPRGLGRNENAVLSPSAVAKQRSGCAPGLAAIAAAAKADPWEEGGALSGALNPRYAKIRDGMQEKQQQSKVARRRGGRRRDDLKDSAYKMPQIVIEQEPASLRRVG